MTSKRLGLIILALIIAGATPTTSFFGCVSVQYGKCKECYHRLALQNGDGCGEFRKADDRCALYFYSEVLNEVRCNSCDLGYALKIIPSQAPQCVKATIPECVIETIYQGGPNTPPTCQACTNGEYAYSDMSTLQRAHSCRLINNPLPHCKYGGVVIGSLSTCYRCYPGHTVDVKTNKCIPQPMAGCWFSNEGKCVACDPEQGYSMDQKGVCFK